jgi:hypothetical protein
LTLGGADLKLNPGLAAGPVPGRFGFGGFGSGVDNRIAKWKAHLGA